ncbi:tetratricopeptide repeat protein [compost metagenome]
MNEAKRARQLHQTGHVAQAEVCYRNALTIDPQDPALKRDLGVLLMQSGRLSEALQQFEDIPQQHPAFTQSLVPRALCERDSGLRGQALTTLAEAIVATPHDPIGWMLHGSLLIGSHALDAAETSLRRCLQLAPQLVEARHFLGECLQRQGRYPEAIYEYQFAMRYKPQEALNIAQCAEQMGDMALARQYYEHAVRAMPGKLNAHSRLLHLLCLVCDFPARDIVRARVAEILAQPLGIDDYAEPFLLCHHEFDNGAYRNVLDHYASQYLPPSDIAIREKNYNGERIHIGYLSADFENHAIGHLVSDLFAAHDHRNFRISGFSLGLPSATNVADRGFDAFFELQGMTDAQAIALIAAQNVDVLLDLSGYTKGARPSLLAARPAGIQLGWLGFVSPQQAPWLDGIIFDNIVQPASDDWNYADRVIRMKSPMLPGTSPAPDTPTTRTDFGLPEAGPLLISVNNTYKLSSALVSAWAAILAACPTANLAVYAPAHARNGISEHWRGCNADMARLIFIDNIDRASHLARMQCCDLMLDAFDYSAGATAIDAAAAGLPMLCVGSGNSPVSRMSASINHYLETPQLIASTTADYVDKAIHLINTDGALGQARQDLLASHRRLTLLNPRRAASEIETICRDLMVRKSLHDA